ncbi:hypothetical protein [Streptococcus sinensis]|uniref:hypothetical protein n=2 Tax=Streptococcus TaxID=1301 RepID=UPI00272AE980|nr:hypothetical protein [Streptococcus sinensis]
MKKRTSKWLILSIVGIALVILGGMQMFRLKTEEERRNREYEVSLVKALKNSYEGIEEIEITEPYYTDKPGSWSCDVKIQFNNGEKIIYGINHKLYNKENHDGLMKGKTNEEIDQQWERLQSHRGKTSSKILVIYSNSERGEV